MQRKKCSRGITTELKLGHALLLFNNSLIIEASGNKPEVYFLNAGNETSVSVTIEAPANSSDRTVNISLNGKLVIILDTANILEGAVLNEVKDSINSSPYSRYLIRNSATGAPRIVFKLEKLEIGVGFSIYGGNKKGRVNTKPKIMLSSDTSPFKEEFIDNIKEALAHLFKTELENEVFDTERDTLLGLYKKFDD